MQIIIPSGGTARCVYSELLDLHQLGRLVIRRGSHVEPDEKGQWFADLSPVGGPLLGPFSSRSQALESELDWLERNWLQQPETWGLIETTTQSDPTSGQS